MSFAVSTIDPLPHRFEGSLGWMKMVATKLFLFAVWMCLCVMCHADHTRNTPDTPEISAAAEDTTTSEYTPYSPQPIDPPQYNNPYMPYPPQTYNNRYQYTCLEGFIMDPWMHLCVDVDECDDSTEPDDCDHRCHNTMGSYVCSCYPGYNLAPDGTSCSDKNECYVSNGGCSHICMNDDGSYTCECPFGYHLDSNHQRTCLDYNECLDNFCQQRYVFMLMMNANLCLQLYIHDIYSLVNL